MDKVAHQSLRWDLEQDLSHLVQDEHLVRQVLDLVMRRVVREQAAEAVRRQRINRDFKTFRRRSVTPPAWAFREPGTSPQVEPLR
ncbi:hypothetical protein [Pseudomonas aeruginosa]|uniref:hypothetical protein n=1 Tax=Pseudomonas aeruginosa TaxID=287 RepID=UPI00053DB7D2|nr:hypothetical protein [Pseudomonas aeruginosa]MCO3351613.1 hypothetical protein [Pseudomonas aeruginosa]OPA44314.1 hypothetical protein BZY57_31920 [Pseudomonas aeruginosa]OVZ37033.1 hypothetical protein CDO41_30430 [Pseudomonas aeruginosa]WBM29839.1 hypothetical protein M2J79_15780 [Pseudomonas aeruginosa]WBM29850.1 hypothetical protein M2J79_15835 [Pseudomonas aeruginosa]